MRVLMILSALAALAGASGPALAGGGGCGDVCDKTAVIMLCKAASFAVADPAALSDEWDKRNADVLTRNMKPGFPVNFEGISWSVKHKFDPEVLYTASVAGLNDVIYSDQLKWPDYDYTEGYRVDPATGAFAFAGLASPGWVKAKAQFSRPPGENMAEFTLRSIATGERLLSAQLLCEKP
jgi:hypothetical protein